MHTLNCFELLFNSVPITLCILGVHTIGSIDELNSVVDRVMLYMRDILLYAAQPIHPSGLWLPGQCVLFMMGSSVAASLVSTICM